MNERIRKLRRALDLTQQEFADRIGSKRNTIAKYETEANTPSAAVISLICREFNVNETWLRTGEGEMFNKNTPNDYWSLPEGQRAELIDGRLYDMAPPSFKHQKIVAQFTRIVGNHIASHNGACEVIPAPFAVNLDADDKNWVEPDISVICDKSKLTDRGCSGAPDLVIEIVSPASRKMDYSTKNTLYSDAGVREYWIVDPEKERVMVYYYEEDAAPTLHTFEQPISVGIFKDLVITISELLK